MDMYMHVYIAFSLDMFYFCHVIMQGFLSGSEPDHWQPAQVGCPALPLPHHPVSTEGHGPASRQGCCPHAPTNAAQTANCLAGRAVMTTLPCTALHCSTLHHF